MDDSTLGVAVTDFANATSVVEVASTEEGNIYWLYIILLYFIISTINYILNIFYLT